MRTPNRVKRASKLTGQDVMALAKDDLLLLIVEDFYPVDACRHFSEKILASNSVERYTHEIVIDGKLEQQYFGVDRLGQPFNATYGAPPGSTGPGSASPRSTAPTPASRTRQESTAP